MRPRARPGGNDSPKSGRRLPNFGVRVSAPGTGLDASSRRAKPRPNITLFDDAHPRPSAGFLKNQQPVGTGARGRDTTIEGSRGRAWVEVAASMQASRLARKTRVPSKPSVAGRELERAVSKRAVADRCAEQTLGTNRRSTRMDHGRFR